MESNLKDVAAAALRICRQQGLQTDILEVAYAACLLEEQGSWGAAPSSNTQQLSLRPSTTSNEIRSSSGSANGSSSGSSNTRFSDEALAVMADLLAQQVLHPQDPAAAATAQLQLTLERSYKQQQDKVEAEQSQQAAEANRLAAAVAYRKVNLQIAGLQDYQSVFEGVVDYVCCAIGLAAKAGAEPSARAQVSAAVESAFPLSGVAYFLTLPAQERLQQMEALARVTCGICLHHAAAGTTAGPSLLPPSAASQLPQAQHLLAAIQGAAAEAEAAMAHYNKPSASAGSMTSSSGEKPKLGAALFCCQAVVSLQKLAADLAAGISCCKALDEGVAAALAQASQVVSSSMSGVAKAEVFPLFESAGRLHLALTGELRLLLVRARLWEDTCAALAAAAADPATGLPKVLGFKAPRLGRQSCGYLSSGGAAAAGSAAGSAGLAESCSGGALSEAEVASLPASMQYAPPREFAGRPDASDAAAAAADAEEPSGAAEGAGEVALAGMCPVSIAGSVAAGASGVAGGEGCGSVLVAQVANPSVGCVRYGGCLYGFRSTAALQAFADAPATTLDAVRAAVRNAPLLAHMLGLTSMAAAAAASAGGEVAGPRVGSAGSNGTAGSRASSRADGNVVGTGAGAASVSGSGSCAVLPLQRLMALVSQAPVKVDAETQTPTHFTERFIDVNYEWNEWALRRRLIALANLRTKATHSAQTVLSHFRRDGDSQTWQLKAAAVQTKVNKGSSMPRKLRYVARLRGAPETAKMKVVALELDIGQTHQF